MYRKIILFFFSLVPFLFFLQPFTIQAAAEGLTASKGTLDLQKFPLSHEVIELNGQWEFYWKQLLTPEDFMRNTSYKREKYFVNAPQTWAKGHYTGNHPISNEGFGTYHLTIQLNKEDQKSRMGVYIPPIASAFKLWVNGELLASNGVVGTSRKNMKPKSYAQVASFVPATEQVEVVIQVSNFSQRKGGIWSPLKLGGDKEIYKLRETAIIKDSLLASSLFALGFFHFSLYLFRIKARLPFFLGIFCFIAAIRILLVGEILFMYLFPSFPWEWSVKIEYLTSYLGLMVVFLFFYHLFPLEINKYILYFTVVFCILFSLTTILPASYFTHYVQIYQIFLVFFFIYFIKITITSIINRREGALLNLLSLMILFAAILNDILFYNQIIKSSDLTRYASLLFLLIQSLVVSKKSSNAFSRVAQLSYDLSEINQSLEQKVMERTEDLHRKNAQLHNIEQTRISFFSSVTHEIVTPMQSIRGYIQLLQAGVGGKEQKKYLDIIYEKTQFLNFLTKDLIYLAKMDEGQLEFSFEETEANSLIEHFFQRFKHDIEKANLKAKYIPISNLPAGYVGLVNVDRNRMEQVFSNLINNAIKFIPKDGTISIQGEYLLENKPSGVDRGTLQIIVTDNGVGIEKELLPIIFDRFVKGTNKIAAKKGTGLGLSICKEIIQRHDGSISVTTEAGYGSRFLITLPVLFVKESDLYESNDINY